MNTNGVLIVRVSCAKAPAAKRAMAAKIDFMTRWSSGEMRNLRTGQPAENVKQPSHFMSPPKFVYTPLRHQIYGIPIPDWAWRSPDSSRPHHLL